MNPDTANLHAEAPVALAAAATSSATDASAANSVVSPDSGLSLAAAGTVSLAWNTAGRLVFTAADGSQHVGVMPVRAFPISAADEGLSLVDADGHELLWIDRLSDMPQAMQEAVQRGLQEREFMPEIERLKAVSSFATPSTWQVDTDRGEFEFVLKGEEDIRRLGGGALLVADSHGVQFLVRDLFALDRHSKKLLDRFL